MDVKRGVNMTPLPGNVSLCLKLAFWVTFSTIKMV